MGTKYCSSSPRFPGPQLGYTYAKRHEIRAHSDEISAITVSQKLVITGCNDGTVKLWVPDCNGFYNTVSVFCGPTDYISSLCVLPSASQYAEILILAGCHDSIIYGFAVNNKEPVMKLKGHSDNVCSLSVSGSCAVSGSWDKTARVWKNKMCTSVLSHQEAVLAVEFLNHDKVLTASSDQTIRLWMSNSRRCYHVFNGHHCCVTGLSMKNEDRFLSCGIDGTVRVWDIKVPFSSLATRFISESGSLVTHKCHWSFIKGLDVFPALTHFATCDKSELKIWDEANCLQTLHFSSKRLSSLRITCNGDLAVGCSDGTLLIIGLVENDVPEHKEDNDILLTRQGFFQYPNGNIEELLHKIVAFNLKVRKCHRIPLIYVRQFEKLAHCPDNSSVSHRQMVALDLALKWDDEYLFPVLDLIRLSMKFFGIHFMVNKPGFIERLLEVAKKTKFFLNRSLVIKIFCNMFGNSQNHSTLQKFFNKIIPCVTGFLLGSNNRIEKAVSALFYNYTLLLTKNKRNIDVKLYCTCLTDLITSLTDSEAIYRFLMGIANVVKDHDKDMASLNCPKFTATLSKFEILGNPNTTKLIETLLFRIESLYDDDSS